MLLYCNGEFIVVFGELYLLFRLRFLLPLLPLLALFNVGVQHFFLNDICERNRLLAVPKSVKIRKALGNASRDSVTGIMRTHTPAYCLNGNPTAGTHSAHRCSLSIRLEIWHAKKLRIWTREHL